MGEHTEGPWEVGQFSGMNGKGAILVRSQDGTYIGQTYTTRLNKGEGNAQLIAAAPELLEACKKLVREIKRCDAEAEQNAPPNHFDELDYSLIQLAQQAIAKAEGEER